MLPKKRPNFLLIMCDQMRGDCIGAAGHPDVKTPYLDTLAAEGTLFKRAYSACPSCIPARAALLTGMSQRRHGRVGYKDGIPWNYPNMLPDVLSKNGWHTEAIGKMHVHPPLARCGFNGLSLHDGFVEYYRDPNKPWREHQLAHDSYIHYLKSRCGVDADITDTGIECNSWLTRPWIYDEMSHPTNWAVTKGLEFLNSRDRSVPFFLKVSFVRPHPPWDSPACYFDMYRGKQLRPPAMGDWAQQRDSRIINSYFGSSDNEMREQGMAGYYASITHMDNQIGRLLKGLELDGILEDTVIIFTSDHGEMLFDHGLFRKVNPYQGSVHIPFIVRYGKNISAGRKQKAASSCVAELRDIAPTMLDCAGITLPETMDGASLVPQLFKEEKFREYLHGEHSGGEFSNHYIVTEKDKYIWFSQSGREQYFDLENDPREEHDAIQSANQSRINELRAALIQELSGREEGYTNGSQLITGRTPLAILQQF